MTTQVRKNVMDMFTDNVWCGFIIVTISLLPNTVMASVIIQVLKVTRLLEVVGWVCESAMALWRLSGESAAALLAAMISMEDGIGMYVSLVVIGTLSRRNAAVLPPAIYLMGNPVQNMDRCLGIAGVHPRYYPLIIAVCAINALLPIWVMQVIA